MYTNRQLNDAIESALESLDITPAMFKEAEGHYKSVATFLNNNGAESVITPFGSIATGTVTRPYAPDEDSYFDFDITCENPDYVTGDCTPNTIREPIEQALLSSSLYHDMTTLCDECLTLEYVLNGKEGGFRLDLNPCVKNTGNEPEIAQCDTFPRYSLGTISIARRNPDAWLGSNPQGLIHWFKDKNNRFTVLTRMEDRCKNIYASIEDIPKELERTSLQRAIQFAKRSRDVYYYDLNGTEKKPSSCVLLVLMTIAADPLPDNASTIDIINAFSELLANEERCAFRGQSTLIGTQGNWTLNNPVYGGNLFSNNWNDRDMVQFFRWTHSLADDLTHLAVGGSKTRAAAQNLFGKRTASASLLRALPASTAFANPSIIKEGHKPWTTAKH